MNEEVTEGEVIPFLQGQQIRLCLKVHTPWRDAQPQTGTMSMSPYNPPHSSSHLPPQLLSPSRMQGDGHSPDPSREPPEVWPRSLDQMDNLIRM